MRRINRIIIKIIFIILTYQNVQAAEILKYSVKLEDKYIRLIFFCKQPVGFEPIIQNNSLNIKFDRDFQADLNSLVNGSNKKILSAAFDNNNLKLTLNNNYKLRKFVSDNFIGIDLIEDVTKNIQQNPIIAEPPIETIIKVTKPVETIKKAAIALPAFKEDPISLKYPSQKSIIKLVNNPDNKSKKLYFDWKQSTAASIFLRAEYLWIIFGSIKDFDLEKLKNDWPSISKIEQIPNDKDYTIIRIDADEIRTVKSYKEGQAWVVDINNDNPSPNNLISEYKSPFSKGIFFPVEDIERSPLTITDPIIGDQLSIILFFGSSYGVDKMKHYVDFKILPSAEGLVINPISQDIKINTIISGVEIIIPEKTITKIPFLNIAKKSKIIHTYSLFPFDEWQDSDKDMLSQQIKLEADIVQAYPEVKNTSRFNLARFYLGIGYVNESIGIMKLINTDDKNFTKKRELYLLQAACEFLKNRYSNAEKYFNLMDMNDVASYDAAEINFWRDANNLKLGKAGDNFDYLIYSNKFLKTYLPYIKQDFAFQDLKNSLDKNKIDHANNLIRELSRENFVGNNANYYQYLKGLYEEKNNHNEAAIALWEPITHDLDDRKNRALAIFASTKNLFVNKGISVQDAINGLKKAEMIWKGDQNEIDILNYLGDIYYNNHNYAEALRTWKKLITEFKDIDNSLFITVRMGQVFTEIFSQENIINQLPDFKAISLFYEFRELTPIGKLGDNIVQNLAYKLVKLDLLDKAADLLEHQINFRLEGDEHMKASTNLAFIYILDRKPDKAIELLNEKPNIEINSEWQEKRKLLMAKALIDSNKDKDAIKLLINDNDREAASLLLSIYYKNKNWPGMIEILNPLVIKKQYDSLPLNGNDEDNILKIAIAFYMSGDNQSLNLLYQKIKDKLTNEKLKNLFDLLVNNQGKIDYNKLEETTGIDNVENFLNNYKKDLTKKS